MDNSNIQRLVDQVNNDVALQARFKSISDTADFEALVSELGYDLTYADFTDAELSDSELTDVAGGALGTVYPYWDPAGIAISDSGW